jgi:hypothetical protein
VTVDVAVWDTESALLLDFVNEFETGLHRTKVKTAGERLARDEPVHR